MKDIFLKGVGPYFWVVLTGSVIYLHTLTFGFTGYDDDTIVHEDLSNVKGISGLLQVYSGNTTGLSFAKLYRPVSFSSFMADHAVGGKAPLPYHATNVLLHIVMSCLVLFMLNGMPMKKATALLLSLVFVVHPALLPAVAWVPGRVDILCGIFSVSALILSGKYAMTGRKRYIMLSGLAFIAALLSKETAAAVLIVAPVYMSVVSGKAVLSKKNLLAFVPFSAVFAAWMLLRHMSLAGNGSIDLMNGVVDTIQKLPVSAAYLGSIFFPFALSPVQGVNSIPIFVPVIGSLIFAYLIYPKGRYNGAFYLGILWFAAFLLPSLAVNEMITSRLYLPVIGAMLAVAGSNILSDIAGSRKAFIFFSAALIVTLAVLNLCNSLNYRNAERFWAAVADNNPKYAKAHSDYAIFLLNGDQLDASENEARIAYSLDKSTEGVNNTLGLISMKKGDLEGAERYFRKELMLYPGAVPASVNLRTVLRQKSAGK